MVKKGQLANERYTILSKVEKTEETVRKGQVVMPVCNFVNLCATAVRVSDKYQQTDSKLFVLWNTIFLCFDNLWLFDNIPML